jgi:uncharacterized membrane protein YhhN
MDFLVLIILFALAVITNLVAEAVNSDVLRYYSKPLLMPLLAFYYWILGGETNYAIIVALWIAFAGDLLLLFPERRWFFILGLFAFLICHICYLIYFTMADAFPSGIHPLFWFVLLIYIFAGIMIYIKIRKDLGNMKFPVIMYMMVIMFLGFVCAARCFKFSGFAFWLPFAGSSLFIISDTILALNRFKKTIPNHGLYIMITYIAAQVMIILGILAE